MWFFPILVIVPSVTPGCEKSTAKVVVVVPPLELPPLPPEVPVPAFALDTSNVVAVPVVSA